MPYFPSAPGGSILLPNTIDNAILTDMPDGTVKGRALGAGVGDPQDLTLAQLRALLGNPVFTQCQLGFVSSSIIRLIRYGGCQLTIDNVPQIIPAAGVDLAATGLTANVVYYIYAYMNAGVMTLLPSSTVPVADARNGVQVMTGDVTRTLVGMAVPDTGPVWAVTQQKYWVISYYNRIPKHLRLDISGLSTASTSLVQLSGFAYFLHWGGVVAPQYLGSTVQSVAASAWHSSGVRVNGNGGFEFSTYVQPTGAMVNTSGGASFAVNAGASNLAFWAMVGAGTGSWTGIITMPLEV